jgi:molybdopterin-guanine dinucleotide biosynthesis protein A
MAEGAPLYGLVLAGGASRRMQVDKATLDYDGRPQLQRAYELLATVTAKTFISVRAEQRTDPTRAAFPQIEDLQSGLGPMAGIIAAFTRHPQVAWLVLACDLPFLTRTTLEQLIRQRDSQRLATAYRSTHDSLPEPLCAIWEPASVEPLKAFLATGKQCPRKFLINSDVALLTQNDARALDNINTPSEYQDATTSLKLSTPASRKQLRVQYFAVFREQAGRSEERIDTTAATPAALYAELQACYPFKLMREQLKVAVNAEFVDWQIALKEGDSVVFIPPVAGG